MWLTQDEIAFLFGRDKSVISRHIRNIFVESELEKDRVVATNATTAFDGKIYGVIFYNLDVVISVGYRVKSQRGILFRKWANKVLKEYLIKGYAINQKRLFLVVKIPLSSQSKKTEFPHSTSLNYFVFIDDLERLGK